MINELIALYTKVLNAGAANPMLSTGVTLWILGVGTVLLRNVPSILGSFIVKQMTTSLTFNNTGWDGNNRNYIAFLTWYLSKPESKRTRSLSIETVYDGYDYVVHIGAGYGYHVFTFKSRLFWFRKVTLQSEGTSVVKEEIKITTLSRSHALITELVETFRYRRPETGSTCHSWVGDAWGSSVLINPRPLSTVMMSDTLRLKLVDRIKVFLDSREWYISRGIPYKLVIVLYGPPGTGKSSIIRALATEFNSDIYRIALDEMTETLFSKALSSIPAGDIVAIEDFDSADCVQGRLGRTSTDELASKLSRMSLSGFLNNLDGIVPLDGTIIIMTTNHLEKIDEAVLRPARTDVCFCVPPLTDSEVKTYISDMFDNGRDDHLSKTYCDITGAELYSHFSDHRYDYQSFINSIPVEVTHV